MRMVRLARDRAPDAADILARAMLDEPSGRWLVPDEQEFLLTFQRIYAHLIRLALDEGRVDAWGDPPVGVAIWLRRPALTDEPPPRVTGAASQAGAIFPVHATARVERLAAVIRQLREWVRPNEHAYLDTLAVLPTHREGGIASRLLDAGHAWADGAGLPCALETASTRNVEFYRRHGYEVRATAPVPGSELVISAMRRSARPVGRTVRE